MGSFAVFLLLSALFSCVCFAQPVPATQPDQYRNEALVWEHLDTSIRMHSDGTGDFVSSRIHYVGIDFGVGRYQPHTAEEVMSNQDGDCKDKDTLALPTAGRIG